VSSTESMTGMLLRLKSQ